MSGYRNELNDVQLIEEIEKHRDLYDKELIGFRNKTIRSRAWADIALKINMDEDTCKRRWRNIRDRFVKIYSNNLSLGINEVKEKQWYLLPHLKFLKEYVNTERADDPQIPEHELTCLTTEEELIAEIRKYKALYAKDSAEYTNKQSRLEAWDKVSSHLNIEREICQKRWRSLRDRYAKICSTSNNTSEDTEANEWYLRPHLEFLKDHITTRKPVQNYCKQEEITLEDYVCNDPYSNEMATISRLANQNRNNRNVCEKVCDILERINDITTNKFEDGKEAKSMVNVNFLKMLNEKLIQIPVDKQEDAKMFILNYLHKLTKS